MFCVSLPGCVHVYVCVCVCIYVCLCVYVYILGLDYQYAYHAGYIKTMIYIKSYQYIGYHDTSM